MITLPEDYLRMLDEIQNSTTTTIRMVNSSTEPKFYINADTREITIPPELLNIGVLKDHNAETIYFEIDRYFDTADFLNQHTCVVQFVNAKGEAFFSPVLSRYEDYSRPDKVVLGWTITENVTRYAGKVQFSVRFYTIGNDINNQRVFTYNYNTRIGTVNVYDGLDVAEEDNVRPTPDDISILTKKLEDISKIIDGITGSTIDYANIQNKPTINGKTLLKGTTLEEIGVIIENKLSTTSENLIQNKIVAAEFNTTKNQITKLGNDIQVKLDALDEKIGDSIYIPLELSNFTNNINIAEKGSKVNTIIFNWNYNKVPVGLKINSTEITNKESKTATLSNQNISTDTVFTIVGTDEKNQTSELNTSIKFLDGFYYGAAAAPAQYDSAFILTLTKTLQENKNINFSANADTNKYLYYCAPAATISANNLGVNGLKGGFQKVATIDFTNSYSYTTSYDIFKSDHGNLGNTIVQVS